VNHRGERRLSATADKPVEEVHPAAKAAPARDDDPPFTPTPSGVQ